MGLGCLQGRVAVIVGPAATKGDEGLIARAHRPRRSPFAPECLVVHVLMHVEQGVDVVATKQIDSPGHVVQVACRRALIEHLGMTWCTDGARRRIVRATAPRIDALPENAQHRHPTEVVVEIWPTGGAKHP